MDGRQFDALSRTLANRTSRRGALRAGGAGAGHAVAELGQVAVGVHNGTDFLRATTGGRVDIVAEALFQGRSQQLWDVVITQSDNGKVLARGQLRLQNIPKPSTP